MSLRELRIRNLAVLRDVTVGFDDGFSVLSGETGSGKSVAITALRLALGERGGEDLIGPAGDVVHVAAVFDQIPEAVRSRLGELGIATDDLLTMSRELRKGGRGSCRINGGLVSQSVCREVSADMAEVTAQGASGRLLHPAAQRELVDAHGGDRLASARDTVAECVERWRAARAALRIRHEAVAIGERDLARARELVADVGGLELRVDEEAQLTLLRQRLRHAAAIQQAAAVLRQAAGGDDQAADLVAAAAIDCAELTAVPEMVELARHAEALVADLRELAAEAREVSASVSVDDVRLSEVEGRLDTISQTSRRYGSVAAALVALEEARGVVDAHDSGDDGIARAQSSLDGATNDLVGAARVLSSMRRAAAADLERAATRLLRQLALPHARFRIVVSTQADHDGLVVDSSEPVRVSSHGCEVVEFRLACNRDGMPLPLTDGPSGGELSRLALALHAIVGGAGPGALILDEVDTGIGGETAAKVGDILAAVGQHRQVVAVTHRPEIAARASSHVVAVKHDTTDGTATSLGHVDGDARVAEMARLLSGRQTTAALSRAAELLVEGRAAGDR